MDEGGNAAGRRPRGMTHVRTARRRKATGAGAGSAAGIVGTAAASDAAVTDGDAIVEPSAGGTVAPKAATPRPASRRKAGASKAGGGRAVRRPAKRAAARAAVRWSAGREKAFLEALAETGNVAEGVRASGLSSASVYRRRTRCDLFRAAWADALREGYVRLETMLLSRAIGGVEKPIWHGGKQVGTTTEYSDRLALALLAHHRDAVGRGGQAATPVATMSEAEAKAELARMLAEMNQRLGGEG